MSRARMCIWVFALLGGSVAFAQPTSSDAGGLAPGWFVAAKNEGEYVVESLQAGTCGGRAAVARSLLPSVPGNISVMQVFRAEKYRGSRVQFSATLDTTGLTGWAGLWMRVDGPDKKTLTFDNMQNRSIQGTAHCVKAAVVLDVPVYAENIALGFVLNNGGRVELGNISLEPVDLSVPTTNLAPPPPLPPARFSDGGLVQPRKPPERAKDPRSDDSMGRVGVVWFSDRIITQQQLGKIRPGSGALHLVGPNSWSDGPGDYTSTIKGDTIYVKGLDPTIGFLATMTGEFKLRREGDTNVIEGTWGTDMKKYPVSIRVSRNQLDMSWGFYERHMLAEHSPQAPPECVFFSRRTGGVAVWMSDAMQVCGCIFDADTPPQQTVIAFLMAGFHRFDGDYR